MFRGELEYHINSNHREEYKALINKVRVGLRLDEAGFLKVPDNIKDGIYTSISSTIVSVKKELNRPVPLEVPEIGLLIGWNEGLPAEENADEFSKLAATATVNEDYSDGIIKYAPRYIASVISSRMGVEGQLLITLEEITAHEMYHIWQFKNLKNKVLKDQKVLANNGFEEWLGTTTEREAIEYANNWIQRNHPRIF